MGSLLVALPGKKPWNRCLFKPHLPRWGLDLIPKRSYASEVLPITSQIWLPSEAAWLSPLHTEDAKRGRLQGMYTRTEWQALSSGASPPRLPGSSVLFLGLCIHLGLPRQRTTYEPQRTTYIDFLPILEAKDPRSSWCQAWFLLRLHSLAGRWLLSPSLHLVFPPCVFGPNLFLWGCQLH